MAFNPFSFLTNIRESIDGILGGLPPQTVKLIGKAGMALAVLIGLALAWLSFQKGLEMAGEEDRAKVLDRKALFLEDIEREYNRKRKEIRWSDPGLNDSKSNSLDIERYSQDRPKAGPSAPKASLEEGNTLSNSRRNEGDSRVFFPNENERPPREDSAPSNSSDSAPKLEPKSQSEQNSSSRSDSSSRLEKPPRKTTGPQLRE
ncbi:LIC_11485 family protein [Leptospira inadai]|nr:hypothetical protein [Leptospira inadai]PNV74892.1 hypothetical protein BES34_011520 [Leptospira inadai serovar Lyme]